MKKYFKIGDKVWQIHAEQGEVIDIDQEGNVKVKFGRKVTVFTHDGRLTNESEVVLSQKPPKKIVKNVLQPLFNVGDIVLSRIDNIYKIGVVHEVMPDHMYYIFVANNSHGQSVILVKAHEGKLEKFDQSHYINSI